MSELSRDTLAEQSERLWLAAKRGLFLYVLDERSIVGGITVLAHVPSADAAFILFDSVIAELTGSAKKVGSRKSKRRHAEPLAI